MPNHHEGEGGTHERVGESKQCGAMERDGAMETTGQIEIDVWIDYFITIIIRTC